MTRFVELATFLLIALQVTKAWVAPVSNKKHRKQSLFFAYKLDGEEIRGPLTPLNNFCFVQTKESLSATSGGILLPDESKQRATEGVVVAAGPGKLHPHTGVRIINPVTEGISVLFGKFDGTPVNYNDEDCQVIRDDDILLYYEGAVITLDNATPCRDYVLVELPESENLQTSSGIVVSAAATADLEPCEGTVVKTGEGRMASTGEFTSSPVAVGDKVKFKDYAGNDVKIEGKEYSVVRMVDILSTTKDSDKKTRGKE